MPLCYSKCTRCRDDRVKCLPEIRIWPEKCIRCLKKNLPCSKPNTKTPGRRRRPPQSTVTRTLGKEDEQLVAPLADCTVVAETSRPQTLLQSDFPDWAFLLSWYPMLQRASLKLYALNEDTIQVFNLHPETSNPQYESFQRFTEDIIPLMLHQATGPLQAQQENQTVVLPLLARLLGNCMSVNARVSNLEERCMACCEVPDSIETKRKMFADAGDLVNDFQVRITRLAGHIQIKDRSPAHSTCDDRLYIRSELDAIRDLANKITTRVRRIFLERFQGVVLPPTIQDSATYIPDYSPSFNVLFLYEGYVDCLGRTGLHRFYDLGSQLHLGTAVSQPDWSYPTSSPTVLAQTDLLGRTPLHILSRYDLFSTGPSIVVSDLEPRILNKQTVYGHSFLHYVGACMNPPFTRLDAPGLDFSLTDVEGNTALFYVFRRCNINIVESFLIFMRFVRGYITSPLLIDAVRQNRPDIVSALFAFPPFDINATDPTGCAALHWAVKLENLTLVKMLGKHKKLQWNTRNVKGYTPLHLAVDIPVGNGILEYLLKVSDVWVNAQDAESGDTALHRAARRIDDHSAEAVKCLIQHHDINVNLPNFQGSTPVNLAMIHLSRNIVVPLLQKAEARHWAPVRDTFHSIP